MEEEKNNQEETQEGFEQEEESQEGSEGDTSQKSPDEKDKIIKSLEGQKNNFKRKLEELQQQGAPQEKQEQTSASIEEVKEEMKFYAYGKSEEDVNQLKAIAQGKNISLNEAKEDPLYKAYEQNKEQETQSDKAQLGASTSSPESGGTASSRDEHQKQHDEKLKELGQK